MGRFEFEASFHIMKKFPLNILSEKILDFKKLFSSFKKVSCIK